MTQRDNPEAMAAYRRRYNASAKGRDARRRYAATDKGREAQRKSKANYNRKNADAIRLASRRRKDAMLAQVAAIKVAAGCADCGYRTHHAALDFDHLDPSTKVKTVSQLVQDHAWEAVVAEIAKCEVVCANCHRVRTFNRRRQ